MRKKRFETIINHLIDMPKNCNKGMGKGYIIPIEIFNSFTNEQKKYIYKIMSDFNMEYTIEKKCIDIQYDNFY